MVNLQEYIHDSTLFNTIIVEDFMVVEYKCLVQDDAADIWTHNNYFAYVLGGEKKWKTPTRECKVHSGEALFVRKGITTVYQYFTEPFIVIFVFVSDEVIENILAKYTSLFPEAEDPVTGNEHLFPIEVNDVVSAVFQSLRAYLSSRDRPSRELLKLKIEELIVSVMTSPGNTGLNHHFAQLGRDQKTAFQSVMNMHYANYFSIADYARLCGRSISSFRRDFRRFYGTTPGKWLQSKRLEHSRFLLETSDMLVNEIMDASGFINRSHFNRIFKQEFGESPAKYRELI